MTTFQLNVIAGCYKWILMMHVVLQKLESGRMWILRSQQIMPIWLSQKVVEPWTSIFRSWLSFSGMLTCSASLVSLLSLVISCVVYLFGDLGFSHFEGFLFDSESFRGSSWFKFGGYFCLWHFWLLEGVMFGCYGTLVMTYHTIQAFF